MARSRGILLQSISGMRLLTMDGDHARSLSIDCQDGEPGIATVLDALESNSRRKWSLILAPSAWPTLTAAPTANHSTGNLRRLTPANLGYFLEEFLPWSAEEFTSQFTSVGERSFGLAILTGDWQPLLDSICAMKGM